jgi:predicted RNA binding protein YcfA (HicA-like mRNA interferase family)
MSAKLPLLSSKTIVRSLSILGFSLVSQKGSHAKYSNGFYTVIVPMHKEVKRTVLSSILRQGNIELDDFLETL